MTRLGAPCPCEQLKERFRPRCAAGPRESFGLLDCRARRFGVRCARSPVGSVSMGQSQELIPPSGRGDALTPFLPLSSRVFSPLDEWRRSRCSHTHFSLPYVVDGLQAGPGPTAPCCCFMDGRVAGKAHSVH